MTVIRIKHDKNYVVLQKEILENPNISLKTKGFWAYCMSKPDDWVFHVHQLVSTLKEGVTAIRGCIKELEKHGYIIKSQKKKERGQFDSFDYEVYETSRFKKSLPQSGFPHADDPLTENQPLLSNNLNQSSSLRSEENTSHRMVASAEASELADFFLKKIKEIKPDFIAKAFDKWKIDFDKMLRIDKRDKERIKEVIDFLVSDVSQLIYVQSASKLRDRFDNIEFKLRANEIKKAKNKNRDYAKWLKEKYPDKMKAMSFDDKYVKNVTNGKEISFDLPFETFKQALVSMFGGGHV